MQVQSGPLTPWEVHLSNRIAECFDYREKNAVIVVARIAIEKVESAQHGHPVVVSLVIANEFGRVICVRGPDEKMINYHVPAGTEMLAATCDQHDLRRKLIYYMGRDGYLVGFNLNWLLTALNLRGPGIPCRGLGDRACLPASRAAARRSGPQLRRPVPRSATSWLRSAVASRAL